MILIDDTGQEAQCQQFCPPHRRKQRFPKELSPRASRASWTDFKSGSGGQEAYVASIHGTQMCLVAAMFTEEYLKAVRSGTMPNGQEQTIRLSKFFELENPDALRILYGLGQYILSGQAEIEQVKRLPRIIDRNPPPRWEQEEIRQPSIKPGISSVGACGERMFLSFLVSIG